MVKYVQGVRALSMSSMSSMTQMSINIKTGGNTFYTFLSYNWNLEDKGNT